MVLGMTSFDRKEGIFLRSQYDIYTFVAQYRYLIELHVALPSRYP